MKTIVPFSFIAALVAFVLLPVNFFVALPALFAAGLAAIVLADYSRQAGIPPPVGRLARAMPHRVRLGLAA